MKAWLVRPNPHNKLRIEEFRNQNIVAVGWPGIGNIAGKAREQIKKILEGDPYNYTSLELGNAYATIDIIVNQMTKGDLILVPNGDDIYFAKVEGDYQYDASKDSDSEGYPHQRLVTWLSGPLNRNQLPDILRKSLKVHRATADLSKHYEIIKLLANGSEISDVVLASENDFIEVDYPIRPGILAKVSIPKNINQKEALRLSDFVKTLYFE